MQLHHTKNATDILTYAKVSIVPKHKMREILKSLHVARPQRKFISDLLTAAVFFSYSFHLNNQGWSSDNKFSLITLPISFKMECSLPLRNLKCFCLLWLKLPSDFFFWVVAADNSKKK